MKSSTSIQDKTFLYSKVFLCILICLLISQAASAETIHIPGTQIEMTQPEGFELADKFSGFQKAEQQTSIMITTIPAAYDFIKKTLVDPEQMATKGITLTSDEAVNVGQFPGTLMKVEQLTTLGPYTKWILLFGNNEKSILINGIMPQKHQTELSPIILEALMSTHWNPDQDVSVFDSLNFSVKENQRFKLVSNDNILHGSLVFKEEIAPEMSLPEDHPVLFITQAFSTEVIKNLAQFSKNRLNQFEQFEQIAIKHTQSQLIDGLVAYEIEAEAQDYQSRTELSIYQIIFATEDTYYIAIGITARDKKEHDFPDFKEIAYSFKQK
ncbi:hypothetical protein [Marinicella sp. W31]|uniref:hypothetical protein n=1 Tax=Marinicella sp. W31 TaxID=3023713 RepID=UPI003757CC00